MQRNGKVLTLEKVTLNPGNVLRSAVVVENRLEALKVLSNTIVHEIEALKKARGNDLLGKIDLAAEVQRFEEDLIRCALLRANGNQRQAARLLGVRTSTLNMKIKRFGISPSGLYQEKELEIPD
jgi:transcriptional regulator with GAF, ATPase, and Fis domain